MSNYIYQNRKQFETRNYVLKATNQYWVGITKAKIEHYRFLFGNDFNLIIFGNLSIAGDFYIIPFEAIQEALLDAAMYEGRNRWMADIQNHVIKFRNSNFKKNLSEYYSIPTSPTSDHQQISEDDLNDYSIENARREVEIRMKQSLFRKRVLKNFSNTCCLSGIKESNLLIASHIIPWADKIETRLDPSNGLCFSVLYDRLFDKGYFTLLDNYHVQIVPSVKKLSLELQGYLIGIHNQKINAPIKTLISRESLAYHREKIFDKNALTS